jgi:hypothetical protein
MAEGFDTNRFHSTIDEGFTCPICFGVLKHPMQCEKNEHYFCSGCINKHLEKTSHSCPVCQDKLTVETLRNAPRLIADLVSHLKIYCDHATRGCDAVLELGALQAHVQDCDFTPVPCSNDGCDEVVNKRDVNQHERELCCFKSTTCDDCGEKMPHNKYGAHGCALRREMNEVKKDVAEIKATQRELKESVQRMTIAIESVAKSCQNLSDVFESMKSYIVVIGGMQPLRKEGFSSVEVFNLFKQTWTPLAELKVPRLASSAVLFENQIFVSGGSCNNKLDGTTNSIEVLNLNGSPLEWKAFSVKLPVSVSGHKCVVCGNRLLIIGGRSNKGKLLDTIYELLLIPPYSSKLLCRMKKRRADHGVELFDNKVLIAGGQEAESDVEVFDTGRNECVEMPPLPSPVWGMATARRGDTMLLIGGVGVDKNVSNAIIEYDFQTGENKVEIFMPVSRVSCSAFCHENMLVIIGGTKELVHAREVLDAECFDFSSRNWRKLSPMIEKRCYASGVIVRNRNLTI